MEEILQKVCDAGHGDVPTHHYELPLGVNLVILSWMYLIMILIVIMFALDISPTFLIVI